MIRGTARTGDWHMDPPVVGHEAGAPDHRRYVHRRPVREHWTACVDTGNSWQPAHPRPVKILGPHANQRIPAAREQPGDPAAGPSVDWQASQDPISEPTKR